MPLLWYGPGAAYHYYYWVGFLLVLTYAGAQTVDAQAQSEDNDIEVDTSATGKLNQFGGFYTPRPFPPSAQYTYSSVWASWSAWSFCANNAQIRVRACNTVRGFSCLGSNRESRPCGKTSPPPGAALIAAERRRQQNGGRDYDGLDPWAEDRREALRQLYADYDVNGAPPSLRPDEVAKRKLEKMGGRVASPMLQARSGGKTLQGAPPVGGGPLAPPRGKIGYGSGPLGPPIMALSSQQQNNDGPAKAPSMTPELLFGSRLEIVEKPINSTAMFEQSTSSLSATTAATSSSSSTNLVGKISPETSTATTSTEHQQQLDGATNRIEPFNQQSVDHHEAVHNVDIQQPLQGVEQQAQTESLFSPFAASTQLPPPTTTPLSPQPLNNEIQQQRTTVSEMPPRAPPVFSSRSIVTPVISALPSAAILEGDKPQRTVLHSGEVAFNRREPGPSQTTTKKDDDIITPETARALEWMLANMTRAADEELRHLELAVADGGVGDEKKLRKNNVHSGEAIISRGKNNHNADDGVVKNRLFSVKSHPSAQGGLKVPDIAYFQNTDERHRHGGRVESRPSVTASSSSSPHEKVKIVESRDPSNSNLPSASSTGAEKEETPEQVEHELAKIQHVMKQIESELEALRDVEAQTASVDEMLAKSSLPQRQLSSGLNVSKLPSSSDTTEQQKPNAPQQQRPPILRKRRPTLHGGEIARHRSNDVDTTSEPTIVTAALRSSSPKASDPPGLYLNLVPTLNDTLPTRRDVVGGTTPAIVNADDKNKILLVQELSETKVSAEWTEWRPWAECFCDRQVRTRVCKYDDAINSKGCSGRSYESRHCISATDKCPSRVVPGKRTMSEDGDGGESDAPTTPLFYTLAPPRPQSRRDADAFRPNPLALAAPIHQGRQ